MLSDDCIIQMEKLSVSGVWTENKSKCCLFLPKTFFMLFAKYIVSFITVPGKLKQLFANAFYSIYTM